VKLTHRLSLPTAEIAYADTAADAPAVVLTHGAGMDHSMFDVQAAALAERGFRVILWDLRGHGESTLAQGVRFTAVDALDDLDTLLIECGIDAPVLIGHSLGGNLSQVFAHQHPRRLRGVVVMDAAWNSGPLTAAERLGLRLAAPSLALIPSAALARLMARASAVTPEAVERTRQLFARMPKARFLDVWKATVSLISPQPDLRMPGLLALIRGAEDRTGSIATSMARWAAAEGIADHVIPRAGHIVTWDAPTEASRTLLQILDEWTPADERTRS
jgi:pimeloyl-ACP methyl ester carboxylesterase